MSNYDDWKTETDLDYFERMGVHRRGPSSLPPAVGGTCACGRATTRSLQGIGWQCDDCYRTMLRRQFERKTRTA